jgi:hypothetical protein
MEWFVFWLGMALLTGWLAGRKGRSGFGWFLFGLVFWPAALIAILVIEPVETASPAPPAMERVAPVAYVKSASCADHSAPARQAPSTQMRSYPSWVAGLAYSEPGQVQTRGEWLKRKGLGAGSRLVLRREPDNPHDANAVAVMWQGQRCGYIPDEDDWVGAAMDRGEDVQAYVERVERSDDPLARIAVFLRIEAPPRQRREAPAPSAALAVREIDGLTCIDQPDGSIQVVIGDKAHAFASEDQLRAVISGIRAKAGGVTPAS